jgi:23S rRNA (uracil1939-C5)-methyltransferase
LSEAAGKSATVQLRIEKPIYGGAGLARADGKAVFVPFTLPGEHVEARIADDRGGYANAEIETVLDPSPARVPAPCPYFGACGGCHYQHAAYAAQVEMKLAILRESLERAHIREIPEIATLTAEPFGYRNRIRLHVQRTPFALCYKRRNSHANLPIAGCPIAALQLQEAVAALTAEGANLGLSAWVGELELFMNPDASSLLLSLWTERPPREAQRLLAELWPRLQSLLPGLTGAAAFASGKCRHAGQLVAQFGENSLRYSAAARNYRVSLGSFFQVNRFLLDALVEHVTGGTGGEHAWDLYAGVGLFSLPLAEKFVAVTAVESSAPSVGDLRENLRSAGRDATHRVIAAETAAFLQRTVEQRLPAPDLVVVDPPRAGLGRDVTTFLGNIRAPRITYVSCDPATLGRDLAALLETGYSLRHMHLVDLFPQTFHLESITHLALDSVAD